MEGYDKLLAKEIESVKSLSLMDKEIMRQKHVNRWRNQFLNSPRHFHRNTTGYEGLQHTSQSPTNARLKGGGRDVDFSTMASLRQRATTLDQMLRALQ
jgi:hypothetical protein